MAAMFVSIAHGQIPTGSLNGLVTDPKDAIIVGARVTAVSTTQGFSRDTLTSSSGLYVLPDLPAGQYSLKIEQTGFATSEFKGIVLEAGRTTTVDAKLQIAAAGTTVEVNAAAVSVNLTQSMIQGEITSKTIESIPLNGRNFLELAYLVPGNRPAPTFDPTKTNTLEVSSAGGFGKGGNITVDGGDNNDEVVGGTLSNFPEDSVQEFQIATGRFTAEVGRSGTSIVNIVSKAGTNQYHGSAFIFERNRNLQALPATFNRSLPTPPFDREQFGASVGGPFRKDRAWWFSSFEFRNQNAAIQTGARDFTTDTILNTSASAPLRDALWSTRYDHQLSEHNSLMVRYSFNRSTDTAEATPSQSTPAFSSAERQNSLNRFNSVIAGLTTVLSSSRVNDLSFHYDNFYNDIPPFPTGFAHHQSAAQSDQRTDLSRPRGWRKLQPSPGDASGSIPGPRLALMDTWQAHPAPRRRVSALHRAWRDQRLRHRHRHPRLRLWLCRPEWRWPGERSRYTDRSCSQKQRTGYAGADPDGLQQLRGRLCAGRLAGEAQGLL